MSDGSADKNANPSRLMRILCFAAEAVGHAFDHAGVGVGEDGRVAVSDRTRKILWSRSGGRCARCHDLLVLDETPVSAASVVGEEAHLVARSPGGPRYAPLPDNEVDDIDNLVLLCRVDHKRIDDQVEEFPLERVREIRTRHEQWVAGSLNLTDDPGMAITHDQCEKLGVPALLTGAAVWSVIAGAHAYDFQGVEEPDVNTEVCDASDEFLQDAHDWGEISSDVQMQGYMAVRDAKRALGASVDGLHALGLRIFGAQQLRPMPQFGATERWLVATLVTAPADDPRIYLDSPSG